MSRILGIDGCPRGWVCVHELDSGVLEVTVEGTIDEIARQYPDTEVAAIDIPIGLSSDKHRRCDEMARSLLAGERRGSVFTTPIRQTLTAQTREEASRLSSEVTEVKVSAQTWGLMPKIKEVDEFVRGHQKSQDWLNEIHPEISFYMMNGEQTVAHSKHTAKGLIERRRLIESKYPKIIGAAEACRCSKFGLDDLYDACAALWTASRIESSNATALPGEAEYDDMGICMRIWA